MLCIVLNSEPVEDDTQYQFGSLMEDTMKGRTDALKQLPGGRTDSTAASENTHRLVFNQSKYRPQLQLITLANNEIIETTIDPKEWRREYERVKDSLKISKQRD